MIATNSLFIGLSIEWEAQERTFTLPTELFVIQITYTLLFLAEVCLKLLAFGARDFFCSSGWAWNCFDLAIVMSAVFEYLGLNQSPPQTGASRDLASNLISDGLQPDSDDLQPNSDGLYLAAMASTLVAMAST